MKATRVQGDSYKSSSRTLFGLRTAIAAVTLAVSVIAPLSALAQSDADAWKWRGTIYLWGAGIDGTASLPATGGTANISVDFDQLLENLNFAFMGTLEARKGRWGGLTDFVYLNVSGSKAGMRSTTFSGPGGIVTIPASAALNADLSLRGTIWTLAGTYTAVEKPGYEMQVLGGFRLLSISTNVNWLATGNVGALPPVARGGGASVSPNYWDAIVGVKGRATLGQSKWYVPYYLDIGAGQSNLTWQGAAGVGYSFDGVDVTLVYRYLDYNQSSGEPIEDISFSGPALGVSFRW